MIGVPIDIFTDILKYLYTNYGEKPVSVEVIETIRLKVIEIIDTYRNSQLEMTTQAQETENLRSEK